jgi:hypothetical protein
MSALITQAGTILQQSAELLKNPMVLPAVQGMFGFLKKAFSGNKRAQERLEMIEKMEAAEEISAENKAVIDSLKTNLDDLLYDNEELQKQLLEFMKKVEDKKEEAGIAASTETTTITTTIENTGANSKIVAGIKNAGDITFN